MLLMLQDLMAHLHKQEVIKSVLAPLSQRSHYISYFLLCGFLKKHVIVLLLNTHLTLGQYV